MESKGADVADKFDFELNTSMALPEKSPAKAGEKAKDAKTGGKASATPTANPTPPPANKANAAPPPERPTSENTSADAPEAGGDS